MDAAGRVDCTDLAALLERLVLAKVDSIGLLGSTGSYAYLTREERRRAVESARDTIAGAVPLIVGVGALRTDEAVALSIDAAAAGADALLLVPMSYTPLTDEEVFAHYQTVSKATRLPLSIYNNPGTTHFTFSPDLQARLAALPGIAGIKNPAGARETCMAELRALRPRIDPAFALGYSGDWHAADALLAGADCWYSVVGGLFPKPALALTRAAQAGDAAEVARLDALFQPLWLLFQKHSSLRVSYSVANLLGLTTAQPPRPILPLPGAMNGQILAAVAALAAFGESD